MASPKHYNDMTEVEICGGGHRTRLKDQPDQLVCLWGAPSPVYKGGEGRPASPPWRSPKRGILLGLQVLVGFHQKGERGKEGEGEGKGKGGRRPPS